MYYSSGNYEAFVRPKSRRAWSASLPTSWARALPP